MLAVGNLSCSIHSIRSRKESACPLGPIRYAETGGTTTTSKASRRQTPSLSDENLVPPCRWHSLCEGAARLTTTEPDHAAGSAVRALGYLAWGLQVDYERDGSVCVGGRRKNVGSPSPAGARRKTQTHIVTREPCGVLREEHGDGEAARMQERAIRVLEGRLGVGRDDAASGRWTEGDDKKAELAAAKCRCVSIFLYVRF